MDHFGELLLGLMVAVAALTQIERELDLEDSRLEI